MRKVIQIEATGSGYSLTVIVLCDDGTIWKWEGSPGGGQAVVWSWTQLPPIPGTGGAA